MPTTPTLTTTRLLLRPWRDDDLPAFAALNADARVMEFFPKRLTVAESDELAARIRANCELHGFGLWAIEISAGAPFVGYVGLNVPRFETHFTPCVEIGWRLAFEHWGKGLATEAAQAAVRFGFEQLGLTEIVSFTVPDNIRSRRVMKRLGMSHEPAEDFDHPLLPSGDRLCRHVLYRLSRQHWASGQIVAE
jgi:ribosomal-protein-alanine N-acetyltransferase